MGKIAVAAKAAPPIGVTGLDLVGIPLSEWVLILTAAYTTLLIVHKGIDVLHSIRRPPGCSPHCQRRRVGDVP